MLPDDRAKAQTNEETDGWKKKQILLTLRTGKKDIEWKGRRDRFIEKEPLNDK